MAWRPVALALVLGGCGLLFSGGRAPQAHGEEDSATSQPKHRLREGSQLVDRLGEFRETGGRFAFYPDGSSFSLQVLENLALERVTRDLDRTRKWSVTGVITEYQGGNYLLLQRAVQKARSPRLAPR